MEILPQGTKGRSLHGYKASSRYKKVSYRELIARQLCHTNLGRCGPPRVWLTPKNVPKLHDKNIIPLPPPPVSPNVVFLVKQYERITEIWPIASRLTRRSLKVIGTNTDLSATYYWSIVSLGLSRTCDIGCTACSGNGNLDGARRFLFNSRPRMRAQNQRTVAYTR